MSFLRASREGDLDGMVSLLAHDAVLYSDGGGKAHAAGIPIPGAERIAKFLTGLGRKAPGVWEIRTALVNGRLGAVTYFEGRLVNVVSLRVEDGIIRNIFIQVNPDKLPRL
jgi:SnoaL-like domain